jgi:hypothetical protein
MQAAVRPFMDATRARSVKVLTSAHRMGIDTLMTQELKRRSIKDLVAIS